MNNYSIAVKEPVASASGSEAWDELESSVYAALETYSNVHRGSGHNSMVSTHLFEQARDIVLEDLALNKDRYVVLFGTPRRVELLKARLKPNSYQIVSSQDFGGRTKRVARGCSLPGRWRDSPACLSQQDHLGQGTGEI